MLARLRRWFSCRNCEERHVESQSEIGSKVTRRLARPGARRPGEETITERNGVSWRFAVRTIRVWSGEIEANKRRRRSEVLLVDRTSLRRRYPQWPCSPGRPAPSSTWCGIEAPMPWTTSWRRRDHRGVTTSSWCRTGPRPIEPSHGFCLGPPRRVHYRTDVVGSKNFGQTTEGQV